MRLYWYWPFLRSEDIGLAVAAATEPVEHLLVHTLDRPGAPAASRTGSRLEVRPDLPEVTPASTGSPRWAIDRARTYAARRRLRAAETGGDHDVVHLWFLNRFTDAVDLPNLARRIPLVVNVHDVRPHNRRLPRPVDDRLLSRIYRSDARLVVHHDSLAERLAAEFGVDRARITTVPLAVRVCEPATEGTRCGDRVLFFGTLRHNKGIPVLLEAIARAEPHIRFEIMGRGESELEDAVRDAADRLPQLEAHVGHIDEHTKAGALERADVVVMPYTGFESQSGVLHDAYAHGAAVVVTDVGALGASVREDGTGVVVAPNDADALLAAVTALLDDDAARDRHATAAATVARDRSPTNVARRLHALYAELTDAGR